MAHQYPALTQQHQQFIAAQKIFFVGTATADSRVNVSPKGMDSFRVLDTQRIAWLNLTDSGNETAAHVQHQPRMTIMFCAFDGSPLILRLYGKARAIHHNDPEWAALAALFPAHPGARQIFDVTLDLVQTSCGMAVPYFTPAGDRQQLNDWASKKAASDLQQYWQDKNQTSIDGIATHIVNKNS